MIITGAYRNKEVVLSPDNTYGYIIIPKNASSWTIQYLTNGWNWTWHSNFNSMTLTDITLYDHLKLIVVLRDPIDRWCSGITQLFWDINKNYDWIDYIKNNMSNQKSPKYKIQYDEHTELQCNFLHNIDTSKCLFFYMDNNYEKNFRKFCHINFIGQYNSDHLAFYKNSSDSNDIRHSIKKLLQSYCKDPTYKGMICEYYKKDYELINSVEFYGKTSA